MKVKNGKKGHLPAAVAKLLVALMLCAVMIGGLLAENVSAAADARNTMTDVATKVTTAVVGQQFTKVVLPPTAERKLVTEAGGAVEKSLRAAKPYILYTSPPGGGTVQDFYVSSLHLVTLNAVPNEGYSFLCWTEDFVGDDGEIHQRLIQDADPKNPNYTWVADTTKVRTLTAFFKKNGTYDVWNDSMLSDEGDVDAEPGTDVTPGQTVTVTATPYRGYRVYAIQYGVAVNDPLTMGSEGVEWQTISTTSTATFQMPAGDVWIRALFCPSNGYTVTLAAGENGSMTFEDGTTVKQFQPGERVKLVVTPDAGFKTDTFSNVPSDFDTENLTFTMPDCDFTLYCTFRRKQYALTVGGYPGTAGTADATYDRETGVYTLEAKADDGYYFAGWYDSEWNLVNPSYYYSFAPTEDTYLIAVFEPGYSITCPPASLIDTFNGVLTVSPAKAGYQTGDVVELIAQPKPGYRVAYYSWAPYSNGAVTGTIHYFDENTFTVGTKSVYITAFFEKCYELSVDVWPNSAFGTVTGAGEYGENETAVLSASPNEGYRFDGWYVYDSDNELYRVSTEPTYTVTMTGDQYYCAKFLPVNYSINAETSNPNHGLVTGMGSYMRGTTVTLKATVFPGYRFVKWTENGVTVSTDPMYTFTAMKDRTLRAVFEENPGYTITFVELDNNYKAVKTTRTTDKFGRLTSWPTAASLSEDETFLEWFYVRDEEVEIVTEDTSFTENTTVIAHYQLRDSAGSNVRVSYDEDYGTALANASNAEFGDVVSLTATPNPGFKFVRWQVFGDPEGYTISDPTALTTTAVIGSSAWFSAEFEYDFPERTVRLDLPDAWESIPYRFTATITADADLTQQPDEFFAFSYKYTKGQGAGGGPCKILSKKINGNTCTLELELQHSVQPPFTLEVGVAYGDGEMVTKQVAFKPCTLSKVNAVAPTCTKAGNIAYWKCELCGRLYSDAAGTTEISAEGTVAAALGHSLKKTAAKAATSTAPGNIAYWTCSRCGKIFRDAAGTEEITIDDTIIPAKAPSFTAQPENVSVAVGGKATFSVTPAGVAPLTYQWQAYNPNTKKWTNSGAAGAKTATVSLTTVAAHNGFKFRCVVTDGNGNSSTSDEATLTVTAALAITGQPTAVSVAAGKPAKFTVTAAGSGTLTYQWQAYNVNSKKWVNSSAASATTANLSVTASAAINGFKFRCVVTDSYGNSVTSDAALLTVVTAPTITKQPEAKSVTVGATAAFSVTATGTGTLTYQWQAYNPNTKKWTNSSAASAKTADFSIKAQSAHNGFKFRCVVTDGNGNSTTSNEAALTVTEASAVPKITAQPAAKTVGVGSTASFSVTATGAGTLTYQWQAYNPNTKKWVNSSSASAKTANFSITAQAAHHNFKFRCVVTDGNGKSVTSNEALLTVRPGIVTQPKDVTLPTGATVNLSITAKGVGTLTYQWQVWDSATSTWKNSSAASAKTANFTFTAQKGHNGKKFRCVLTDSNGNQTVSRGALVTVETVR